MQKLLVFSLIALSLSSCKKMALRHTCSCELKRSVDGKEENLGNVTKEQIGTYSRAKDNCTVMEDDYTYTTNRNGYPETYTAHCQVK
jgi:hypothetical protein